MEVTRDSMEVMREKFEAWIERHLEFETLQNGRPATEQGVLKLTPESTVLLRKAIGYACLRECIEFRRGARSTAKFRVAVQEILECDSLDELMAMRRDQWLTREIEGARRFDERNGCAPDGGWIFAYEERAETRANILFPRGGETQ